MKVNHKCWPTDPLGKLKQVTKMMTWITFFIYYTSCKNSNVVISLFRP